METLAGKRLEESEQNLSQKYSMGDVEVIRQKLGLVCRDRSDLEELVQTPAIAEAIKQLIELEADVGRWLEQEPARRSAESKRSEEDARSVTERENKASEAFMRLSERIAKIKTDAGNDRKKEDALLLQYYEFLAVNGNKFIAGIAVGDMFLTKLAREFRDALRSSSNLAPDVSERLSEGLDAFIAAFKRIADNGNSSEARSNAVDTYIELKMGKARDAL